MGFKKVYTIYNVDNEQKLLGVENSTLKLLEKHYNVNIVYRNMEFLIDDESFQEDIASMLMLFEEILNNGRNLEYRDYKYLLESQNKYLLEELKELYLHRQVLLITNSGKQITPRTINQKKYLTNLKYSDISFGIGPAGTGKTYLAIMYAVSLLKANKINKILLVRPVVEAGEKLGFLPGDLKDKIDPYLIPLYDALHDALGKEKVDQLVSKGIIEVAPLAYMRGRTLEKAVVILDEAQNSTTSQMKMFLTRLGVESKMIITGDISQIDLDKKSSSGLIEAIQLLRGIDGISFNYFDKNDVMRHRLVQEIINRYEVKND